VSNSNAYIRSVDLQSTDCDAKVEFQIIQIKFGLTIMSKIFALNRSVDLQSTNLKGLKKYIKNSI